MDAGKRSLRFELKDVDLKNNEIVIRRLKGSCGQRSPSRRARSTLAIRTRVLRDWLKERGEHPSKYVFVSQKSGKLNRSTFTGYSLTRQSVQDCQPINGILMCSSTHWEWR